MKKSLVKNIIKALFSLALLTLSVQALAGENFTSFHNPASIINNADWLHTIPGHPAMPLPAGNPGYPRAGDNIWLGGAHDLRFNAGDAADIVFGNLDISNRSGRTITIADLGKYSIANLNDTGGLLTDTLNFTFEEKGLVVIANTQGHLGNVTGVIGDFLKGTIVVKEGEVQGIVDYTAVKVGAENPLIASNVTFNGVVKRSNVTITTNTIATFNSNIDSAAINLSNDSTAIINTGGPRFMADIYGDNNHYIFANGVQGDIGMHIVGNNNITDIGNNVEFSGDAGIRIENAENSRFNIGANFIANDISVNLAQAAVFNLGNNATIKSLAYQGCNGCVTTFNGNANFGSNSVGSILFVPHMTAGSVPTIGSIVNIAGNTNLQGAIHFEGSNNNTVRVNGAATINGIRFINTSNNTVNLGDGANIGILSAVPAENTVGSVIFGTGSTNDSVSTGQNTRVAGDIISVSGKSKGYSGLFAMQQGTIEGSVKKLATLNVAGTGVSNINGAVDVDLISTQGGIGGVVNFNQAVAVNTLRFNNESRVVFNDYGPRYGVILTEADNRGIIDFNLPNATYTPTYNIGEHGLSLKRAIFRGNDSVYIFSDAEKNSKKVARHIYSYKTDFIDTTAIIQSDVTLGYITSNNAEIRLDQNKLTSVEGGAVVGPITVSTVIYGDSSKPNAGVIYYDGGNTNFSQASEINLKISATRTEPLKVGEEFIVFDFNTSPPVEGKILPLTATINTDKTLTGVTFGWKSTNKIGAIFVKERDDMVLPAEVRAILGRGTGDMPEGAAAEYYHQIIQMEPQEKSESAIRLTTMQPHEVINDATAKVSEIATNKVYSYLRHDNNYATRYASLDNPYIAVSAGDNLIEPTRGLWVEIIGKKAIQGQMKNASGYKIDTSGFITGGDIIFNDSLTLGAAIGKMDTKVNYRHLKTGDRTEANSWIFSLYGMYSIDQHWFMQAITSYINTKLKDSAKRLFADKSYRLASSNYSSIAYSADITAGYRYTMNEKLMLTPSFSLSHLHSNSSNYQEKGADVQDLSVTKKPSNIVTSKFSLGLDHLLTADNQGLILHETRVSVSYDFYNKAGMVTSKLNGQYTPFEARVKKKRLPQYNIGTKLVITRADKYEYWFGYDLDLAKKYIAHEGSFKFKVNF